LNPLALVLLSVFAIGCRTSLPPTGTVVVAWEAFPLSFDPRLGQDQASQRLLGLTHQGLLKRNAALEFVPDACLDWRWERPYEVLSFDFPDAAAASILSNRWYWFEPERPLRAEDAADAIEALRDPNLASPKSGPYKAEIERLEIEHRPGLDRLRIHLKASNPGFPPNLGRAVLGIAPKGMRGSRLPGTGPYRIVEVVPEQRILLEPKENHPDLASHAGQAQSLDLRLLPDATTRLLALRHGSVQASLNNLPADLLGALGAAEATHFPGANLEYVAFRCDHPVLRDSRVRKALCLVLDRESMVKGLMGGLAREAWGFYPPELAQGSDARASLGLPGSQKDRLGLAEALLDAAGQRRDSSGRRFSLKLSSTPEVAARMKALVLQAQWRTIGVEVEIVTREFGTLLTEVMAGKFEAVSLRWVGVSDPEMLYETFHSSKIPPGGFNRGRFSDPGVDRLLEAARSSGRPEERLRLLREVQVRLVDLAPYAFLWWPDQVAVLAPGLEVDLNASGDFRGLWRHGAGR
jgi:peptide/nickel transport system substrate-binding protein